MQFNVFFKIITTFWYLYGELALLGTLSCESSALVDWVRLDVINDGTKGQNNALKVKSKKPWMLPWKFDKAGPFHVAIASLENMQEAVFGIA